jgi:hypothetical protein
MIGEGQSDINNKQANAKFHPSYAVDPYLTETFIKSARYGIPRW